ncbi:MAG: cell division protein FtsZ, partial [bacterium]
MIQFEIENLGNARMKVIGVGGAGNNAVNRMILADLRGVDFIAVNTDCQHLSRSLAPIRVQIGSRVSQ